MSSKSAKGKGINFGDDDFDDFGLGSGLSDPKLAKKKSDELDVYGLDDDDEFNF